MSVNGSSLAKGSSWKPTGRFSCRDITVESSQSIQIYKYSFKKYIPQTEGKPVPLSCPDKGTTIKAPYWKQAALRKVQKIWER